MMTNEELIMLQSLPLDIKIAKTKLRIREWIEYFGENNVYISFSGGKDSTVLLDLIRQDYPNVMAVFVDTGLEYPEIKDFVKTKENVIIIRPKISFKQVVEKYGYPVVSKEQSRYIYEIRNSKNEELRQRRLSGDEKGRFKLSKKWSYLLDAPFKISHYCCNIMKKNPIHNFEDATGKVAIIGTLACESILRKQSYMNRGCNVFDSDRPISTPIAFWTEQDILQYIKNNNLDIASVYGSVVTENETLKTTGVSRTGCIFCLMGIENDLKHNEKNRLQLLEETHPKLHKYCMKTLGLEEVCQYMDIPFDHRGEEALLYES